MKAVFADTSFYIALLNSADEYHAAACRYTRQYAGRFVTTAWIVVELANLLSRGANRPLFLSLWEDLRGDARVEVVPPSEDLFRRGLELYARRPDKNWSLTDCISFVVMTDRGLQSALTADHHFEQAGFGGLLHRPD